jgi:hypothetical protein
VGILHAAGSGVSIISMVQAMMSGAISSMISGLHFDGTNGSTAFTDVTGKVWTRNGTVTALDTSIKKFGTASLNIGTSTGGATNNGINTPASSDFDFGTGEFTVACWCYFSASESYQTLFNSNGDDSGGIIAGSLIIQTGTALDPIVYIGGTSRLASSASATSASEEYWEFCRDKSTGDILRMYRSGVSVGSFDLASISSPTISGSTYRAAWGAYANGHYAMDGYLDDCQVYKGRCLHAGGTTFTPPTSPFTYP